MRKIKTVGAILLMISYSLTLAPSFSSEIDDVIEKELKKISDF